MRPCPPHLLLALLLALAPSGGRSAVRQVLVKMNLGDNLAKGQQLGNLSTLSPAIPPPPADTGRYSRVVINPHRFVSDRFHVDQRLRVSTKVAVDRDSVCATLGCCRQLLCETNFTLFVRFTPVSGMVRVVVTLSLRDANDNTPVVPSENITLPESASIGSTRPLLVATDKDSPMNGVKSYHVEDRTKTFGLHMESAGRPMLRVLKRLDADDAAARHFSIVYSATDGERTGYAPVQVRILDENDNAPIFTTYSRTKMLSENTSVGSEVYRFEAKDGDVDYDNRRVSFHLDNAHSTPEGVAWRRFEVNANTGAVLVRSPLDYDKSSERQFRLVVEARDHGSPALSSTATLTVILLDVNDNDPVIAVTSSQPLQEEKAGAQTVRTISVSDRDQQESIKVQCALRNSPGFAIQPINGNHYFDLVAKRRFDFETTPSVNVTIACTDQMAPRRTVERVLTIPVVDINDHGPVFSPAAFTKTLVENAPLQTEVLTVTATDRDSGDLGKVRYSLDPDGQKWFSVDEARGIVFVNSTLDREAQPEIRFRVWAADHGRPPRRAFAPVRIVLNDTNDNPPALDGPKAVDVVENARPGTVITRVRFRDPDLGSSGRVSFRLIRDNNLSLRYLNMTADGRVVVLAPVDREVTPRMYLDIQARDLGTPVLETTVSLIVRVLDLNDNRPRLVSPADRTVLGRREPAVRTNAPFNTTVADLRAHDADLRENGSVVFDLLSSNASGMFKLDPFSGRLYSTWKYPSRPGSALYELRVRLSDRGRPPLSSEATLYVAVSEPLAAAGISNIIILVLILVASLAIAAALVMAILWARSRSKRAAGPGAGNLSPDYAEYDPAVKKPRSVGDSETVSNVELGAGLALDPVGDSASTLARSQKTPSRMSQYTDYVIPYPMAAASVGSKRDSRSPHSFENSYPGQIRTFGHQSPVGQSFMMENFSGVGRPGATSPASYQQRPIAFANPHLLPEMYEDDPRQSELSYDDSGKGGSVDDVGRFVLAPHAPSSVASSSIYPLHHHHHAPHRLSLRGSHPGGPGHLSVGAEATLC